MNDSARKWGDLKSRLFTGVAMAVVGIGAVWLGGIWLKLLVSGLAAVMIWELVRMLSPQHVLAQQVLPVLSFISVFLVDSTFSFWPIVLVPVVAGTVWVQTHRITFLLYSPLILLGAISAYWIRQFVGLNYVLVIVAVVVATDLAGYFVGRLVGGPKFWPKISPKKTWSGTVGGWIAAAIVGAAFAEPRFGTTIAMVAVAVALASQFGDIAESAIKRRAGIKDSSNLLPGHGGFMDRMDGMIAAFTLALIFSVILGASPGSF